MYKFNAYHKTAYNNRFQPTVKSVIFFAKAKKTPLFTSAEAGVSTEKIGV
jgi:hypothetical protein